MKNYGFFVMEDGSPEAADYDDSYVFYSLTDADGYEVARQEVRRRCVVTKAIYPKMSCACPTACACRA